MAKFGLIKKYLRNLRTANYEILRENENMLQFKIITDRCEKLFTVHYVDGFSEDSSLSRNRLPYHYYYLQFEQGDYPINEGTFATLVEWKWYVNEDDILARIKNLRRSYLK